MSKVITVSCNGCGKEKKVNDSPILISDMDRSRDSMQWASCSKGEIYSTGIGVVEFDFCQECWLIGLTAIMAQAQKVGA